MLLGSGPARHASSFVGHGPLGARHGIISVRVEQTYFERNDRLRNSNKRCVIGAIAMNDLSNGLTAAGAHARVIRFGCWGREGAE